MIFKGTCTALITPFNKNNKVNFLALKNLIDIQLRSNVSALLVLGTTAESPTLTEQEKIDIIKFSAKTINKKIPLIIGSGSNNTETAIYYSKLYQKLGADALLVITPYYNKTTQKGLLKHFSKIAENVDLPIILYNVPSRTGVNILPETVFALSKIHNIVGIKEASGNLNQIAEIIKICDKDFCVFSGDDNLTLPILSLGGQGVISVSSNLYPEKVVELCNSFFDNDIKTAQKIFYNLFDISKKLFCEVNPIPIKTALNIIGRKVGKCRLPLTTISKKHYFELKKAIQSQK